MDEGGCLHGVSSGFAPLTANRSDERVGVATLSERRSRKFGQRDRWSFCLMAGTLCPSDQERP